MASPPAEQTRAEIQQAILERLSCPPGDAVDRVRSRLGGETDDELAREQLEAHYDRRNLLICDTCALVYPWPPDGETIPSRCVHCDGTLLDWPARTKVTTVAERLNNIRVLARERAQLAAD